MKMEKYFDWLDGLRESGRCNMFFATKELMKAFPKLSQNAATRILAMWMVSFDSRHPPKPPKRRVVKVKGNIDNGENADWLHKKK